MAIAMDIQKYQIMECPVCYEYLRPPVTTCNNGHGICQDCRKNSDICGICRERFTDIKNTLLDQMIESLLVKCSSKGCNECTPISDVKDHAKKCYYRQVECCTCHVKDIYLPDLNNHFKIHDDKFQRSLSFCISYCMPLHVHKWNASENLYFILYITSIQTYFLLRFFYRQRKSLYFCVQYIGKNQEEANNYKYDIKIDQGLPAPDKSFFTCSGLCIPYTCNDEETITQEKVIKLDFKSIFLTNDYLSKGFGFDIQIKKLGHNRVVPMVQFS